jgi:hypothetical protein
MLTGCTLGEADVATTEAVGPSSPSFLTSNDLLYPPELWGALEPSTVSALLRHQTLAALGDQSPWRMPLVDTLAAASVELSEVESAFLIHDSGVVRDAAPPWSEQDIRAWWRTAVDEHSIDHMWMAAELARAHGAALRPSETEIDLLRRQASSNDMLPGALAAELLDRWAAEPVTQDGGTEGSNVRTPRDAAQLLLRDAEDGQIEPTDTARQLLAIAESAAPEDDWTRAYLVRAYVAAARPDDAGRVAGTFAEDRLLPGGSVLEPPVFVGSVGSTFRMLRLVDVEPEGPLVLDDATRARIATATRALLDVDLSHEVAGTAVLHLLDPDEVPVERRAEVIAGALASELGEGPLSLEQAVAWTALAPYAVATAIELPFPGLSSHAIHQWTAEESSIVAASIVHFVLALQETGQLAGQDVGPLIEKVESLLSEQPASAVDSTLLFGGSLAVRAVTGRWPYDEATLRAELENRRGDCLGGFDGYIRETSSPGAHCNVDSTRYAILLAGALEDGQR